MDAFYETDFVVDRLCRHRAFCVGAGSRAAQRANRSHHEPADIRQVAGHVLVDVSLFPEGERELGTGIL